MESFVKLPKIKSINQIADLRIMYDQLETTVRNLRTLDVSTETYGSFLVPLLTQKLPSDLTIIMSRQFKSELWELKDMLVMFKEELEAKERCAVSVDNTSRRDNVASFSTVNLHQQQGNRASSGIHEGREIVCGQLQLHQALHHQPPRPKTSCPVLTRSLKAAKGYLI